MAEFELEHVIGRKGTVLVHPNGEHLIYASGGSVIISGANDIHDQSMLHGHKDIVKVVTVSHTGDLIASGDEGNDAGDVIIWDFSTQKLKFRFEEHDYGIAALCFTHDDRYLISCGNSIDKQFIVWDASQGTIITHAELGNDDVSGLVCGGWVRNIKRRDQAKYQIASCAGNAISVWHIDVHNTTCEDFPVNCAGKQTRIWNCLTFSDDYEYLYAGTSTGDVCSILMKNLVIQQFADVCHNGVRSVQFRNIRGMNAIFAGGGDGTLSVLVCTTPTTLTHTNQVKLLSDVQHISFHPSSEWLVAARASGDILKIKSDTLDQEIIMQHQPGVHYKTCYPDGVSDIFAVCGSGGISVWNANDYRMIFNVGVRDKGEPQTMACSSDILVAGYNSDMRCYNMQTGSELWKMENVHSGGVSAIQLASNMRFIVTAGDGGDLRLWEMKTKSMIAHLKDHTGRVNDMQLFPNDQFAISVSRDRCLLTWDLLSEKRLTLHREKHGGINSLALCQDQTTVLTAGQEKTLTTWDLRQPNPVYSLETSDEIVSLAIPKAQGSPNLVASGGHDRVVRLWDLRNTNEPIQQSKMSQGHTGCIQSLAFSDDYKQLVSVAKDGCVFVWNIYANAADQQAVVAQTGTSSNIPPVDMSHVSSYNPDAGPPPPGANDPGSAYSSVRQQ